MYNHIAFVFDSWKGRHVALPAQSSINATWWVVTHRIWIYWTINTNECMPNLARIRNGWHRHWQEHASDQWIVFGQGAYEPGEHFTIFVCLSITYETSARGGRAARRGTCCIYSFLSISNDHQLDLKFERDNQGRVIWKKYCWKVT